MCLDAGSSYGYNCSVPPVSEYPFCNWTLPVDQRLDDLISRMTLTQLMSQLITTAPALPNLGVPSYQWV